MQSSVQKGCPLYDTLETSIVYLMILWQLYNVLLHLNALFMKIGPHYYYYHKNK